MNTIKSTTENCLPEPVIDQQIQIDELESVSTKNDHQKALPKTCKTIKINLANSNNITIDLSDCDNINLILSTKDINTK